MKTNKILCIFIALLLLGSCSDDFLDEKPMHFYAPETVLSSPEGFETALIGLYTEVRKEFALNFDYGSLPYGAFIAGTDLVVSPAHTAHPIFDGLDKYGDLFHSEDLNALTMWGMYYQIVANANQIISHAEELNDWGTCSKEEVLAEAKFFRAYAYRGLLYFFNKVPIVDKIEQPFRTDFKRNSKQDVLNFIIADLEMAVANLPTEAKATGRVTRAVAKHYLGEMYIYNGEYDKAITMLDDVINNTGHSLITERFGVDLENEGDYYSDIHKKGNQNHPDNTEALWVIQQEWNTPGGDGWGWERRIMVPAYESVWGLMSAEEYGGPGRGRLRLLEWVYDSFDENDIRGSSNNLRRIWIGNAYWATDMLGDTILPTPDLIEQGYLYPYMRKHEDYIEESRWESVGYKDRTVVRLAETYLLKAEAQLMADRPGEALATLNIIRNRAQAEPLNDINLDILLDERARELAGESPRRYTLVRTGSLVSRVRRLNPHAGEAIQDYNKFFPVPQSIIDANTSYDMEQNTGY